MVVSPVKTNSPPVLLQHIYSSDHRLPLFLPGAAASEALARFFAAAGGDCGGGLFGGRPTPLFAGTLFSCACLPELSSFFPLPELFRVSSSGPLRLIRDKKLTALLFFATEMLTAPPPPFFRSLAPPATLARPFTVLIFLTATTPDRSLSVSFSASSSFSSSSSSSSEFRVRVDGGGKSCPGFSLTESSGSASNAGSAGWTGTSSNEAMERDGAVSDICFRTRSRSSTPAECSTESLGKKTTALVQRSSRSR